MTWWLAGWWVWVGAVTFGLPALVVQGLLRGAELSGKTVRNYRGRQVARVLGVSWLAWAFSVPLAWLGSAVAWDGFTSDFIDGSALSLMFGTGVSAVLAVGAFACGFIDDAHGDHAYSGLKGHLSAARKGVLTTGLVKLVGIGALAVLAGLALVVLTEAHGVVSVAFTWVTASVVVAGSANLVNLADLRPLRGLKAYALCTTTACAVGAASISWTFSVSLAAFLAGPLAAVWPLDAAERGMLGDAGANAAGAVAGFWMVLVLARWPVGLALAAALIVGLNLVSERVSFSEVIEGNRALKWLDMLGRPKE